MAKRLIETTIWTQNKWFRKLKPQHKLLWIYLFSNCDSVGVWEEDLELASFIIGIEFTRKEIDEVFGTKIKWINDKKLWIVDFCHFQYGNLIEENTSNRPHQSYIALLKKHSLWIDYIKTMERDKEKETDKEEDNKGGVGEKIDYDFIAGNYHSLCPKMNKVSVINDQRKGFINARVGEFGMDKVISVLRMAGESEFLNGKNDKAWKADFEWIMRPTNFVKILEGKYKNNAPILIKPEFSSGPGR
jgi:hypothetical protein